MSLFVGKAIFIICIVLAIVVLFKIGTLLFVQRNKE
jgi:hypothetical protein